MSCEPPVDVARNDGLAHTRNASLGGCVHTLSKQTFELPLLARNIIKGDYPNAPGIPSKLGHPQDCPVGIELAELNHCSKFSES